MLSPRVLSPLAALKPPPARRLASARGGSAVCRRALRRAEPVSSAVEPAPGL